MTAMGVGSLSPYFIVAPLSPLNRVITGSLITPFDLDSSIPMRSTGLQTFRRLLWIQAEKDMILWDLDQWNELLFSQSSRTQLGSGKR